MASFFATQLVQTKEHGLRSLSVHAHSQLSRNSACNGSWHVLHENKYRSLHIRCSLTHYIVSHSTCNGFIMFENHCKHLTVCQKRIKHNVKVCHHL